MKIETIVRYVNKLLGDGLYDFEDLVLDADSVIDEINEQCKTTFRYFSEYDEEDSYTEFSDKYIRNVLCYGIAIRLLEQEDEYESQYHVYRTHYETWLNRMANEYLAMYDLSQEDGKINLSDERIIAWYTAPDGTTVIRYETEDGIKERNVGKL